MIGFNFNQHHVKSVRIRSYSRPHVPESGLNTERYGISLHIQSKCPDMGTRITPNMDTFHVVQHLLLISGIFHQVN